MVMAVLRDYRSSFWLGVTRLAQFWIWRRALVNIIIVINLWLGEWIALSSVTKSWLTAFDKQSIDSRRWDGQLFFFYLKNETIWSK